MISYDSLLNKMQAKAYKFVLLVFIVLLAGCSAGKQSLVPVREGGLSDKVQDHVIAGALHESQGDFHWALMEYNQAMLLDSARVELYMVVAEMYQRMNELESAEITLDRGLQIAPEDREMLRFKAEIQFHQNSIEEAILTFKKLVEIYPDDENSWKNLSILYERSGRSLEAINCYDRLVDLVPEDKDVLLSRKARAYLGGNELEKAIDTYKDLQKAKPEDHLVPFYIGGIYLELGDTTKASNAFEDASRIAPSESRYWTIRIRLKLLKNKRSEVLSLLDEAVEATGDAPEILEVAGGIYLHYNVLDKAESSFRKLLEIMPEDPMMWVNLGFVYHNQKDWKEAEEAYLKAIQLDNEDPQIKNNYAYMLAEAGRDLEMALSLVEEALEVEPENPSFLDTKGWLFYRMGQYEKALTYLRMAVELDPSNFEVLEHLGDLYLVMGNLEKAREMWQTSMNHGGDKEKLRTKMGIKP